MLTPKQLDDFPQPLIDLFAEVEADIIKSMAERIAAQNYFIPAAEWQYKKLIEMGLVHDEILKKLSATLGKSRGEIERIMKSSGVQSIKRDASIYKKHGLDPPLLRTSPNLMTILQTGIDSTNGLFQNLTYTTASTASNQFVQALDKAWLQINTGAFDHNSVIQMAVKELASKGLESIKYPPTAKRPNGRTDHVDVAVRRAMITGINRTSILLSEQLADELGCDLMDITAHAGARTGIGPANHAAWQGKRVSRSGQQGYLSLKDIGYGTGPGFGGWNCRHNWMPAFEGTDPAYSQEELDDLNAEKYTYNGQSLTEENAVEIQRGIERNIRKYKREFMGMQAAGQPTEESASKLYKWQERQKDFIKQTGLKRQYEHEKIEGFNVNSARKASKSNKSVEYKANQMYNIGSKEANVKAYLRDKPIRDKIKSNGQPKTIEVGQQNKHIPGTNEYRQYVEKFLKRGEFGPSKLTIDMKTAQDLVNQYHGTGIINRNGKGQWLNEEVITTHEGVVGIVVNNLSGAEAETTVFKIKYGKRGTHIFPDYPSKKGMKGIK